MLLALEDKIPGLLDGQITKQNTTLAKTQKTNLPYFLNAKKLHRTFHLYFHNCNTYISPPFLPCIIPEKQGNYHLSVRSKILNPSITALQKKYSSWLQSSFV